MRRQFYSTKTLIASGIVMKTIGVIGGMSWVSTAFYYRALNEIVRDRLGGFHSAKILMWSADFAEIEALQTAGKWEESGAILAMAAARLERAGAEAILITSNTMHKMAAQVETAVAVPLLHIADATATEIKRGGVKRPLLLATAYTMEQDFYVGRLRDVHGVEVVVPHAGDRAAVHEIIYSELVRDVVNPKSKTRYLEIVARARAEGADAIIFGCTEIGMLIAPSDFDVPCFDTTVIHANAAVDFMLS